MPRIRTIKPEFWLDEDLATVSSDAALLAIGLLNISDDEGFFNANAALVKAAIFPIRETSSNVTGLLLELSRVGYIGLFSGSDSKSYGQVTNFSVHQVISHAKPSKIKGLTVLPDGSSNPPLIVLPEGKGKEGKGKERNGPNKFIPPTQIEVCEYFKSRNCTDQQQSEKFVAFYTSKGWMVGKNKMKDWEAACRNWLLNNNNNSPPTEPLSRAERAARDAIA